MPTIVTTVEVEAELDDFDTEDLIEELETRRDIEIKNIDLVDDAFEELFRQGVPLETVLHNLFKNQPGYNYHLIENLTTKQG